jgi:copper chaperone NosL
MARRSSLVIAVLVSLLASCSAPPARQSATLPPANAKCPVCGMFVAKYTNWVSALAFKDGTSVYFDGPKDLLAYYLDMKKFDPARSPADVAAVQVKNYYDLSAIDGREAFYVIGSDVTGPMGNEAVPFRQQGDAAQFLRDHDGKRVVRFGEVTPELLKTLE